MGNYVVEEIFNKKDKRYIIGENTLNKLSIIPINGAKNSALPVLVASLLINNSSCIKNIPNKLNDVQAMIEILNELGCNVDINNGAIFVDTSELNNILVKQEVASKTRYSSLLMGALLARFKNIEVPYPGGCKLGDGRPIDIHIEGLKALGVLIKFTPDKIILNADKGLKGAVFELPFPSVGATENLLLASCLADGVTILNNCACEPEVNDLVIFLNKAGAKIKGMGTSTLEIEGVESLTSCEYCIVPDRIEVGTFIAAAVVGRCKVVLAPVIYDHVKSIIEKFIEIGVKVDFHDDILEADASSILNPVDIITGVYPAIPTDMQPIFTAALLSIAGESTIKETVYRNRFAHVGELIKMGANISIEEDMLTIKGGERLKGASVYSFDLRAGASLLVSSLMADGVTEILNVQQIERGYFNIVEKMKKMGVNIEVIE